MAPDRVRFADWLRKEREGRDLTQRELAALTGGPPDGIGNSTVHRVENGERKPGLSTLRGLSVALGVEFTVDKQGRVFHDGVELTLD